MDPDHHGSTGVQRPHASTPAQAEFVWERTQGVNTCMPCQGRSSLLALPCSLGRPGCRCACTAACASTPQACMLRLAHASRQHPPNLVCMRSPPARAGPTDGWDARKCPCSLTCNKQPLKAQARHAAAFSGMQAHNLLCPFNVCTGEQCSGRLGERGGVAPVLNVAGSCLNQSPELPPESYRASFLPPHPPCAACGRAW